MSEKPHPGATLERLGDQAIHGFMQELRGELITPEGESYDDARRVWNGLMNDFPALIVRCAGASDVMAAVDFARENDLDISVNSGGHHETGSAVVQGGLVVDFSEMDSVQVDPEERTVRVEPGVRAGELHHETQQFGLATPTGSADDIAIAGSTLGAGIGWIRRKHGLGIDALRSVDLVTADGDLVTASRERNSELFWGMCGAGGNFGVATAFEFDLYPVGPEILALSTFYPAEHAPEVLDTLQEFVAEGHEALTPLALYGHVPPLPMVPPEAHGRDAVGILGCYAGPVEEGKEVVAPLREIADPIVDMTDPMPYVMLHELGTALFPEGRNYCWRSSFVEEMTDDIQQAVIEHGDRAPSPLCSISVWPMDGAVQERAADDAAYPWRDHDYMLTVEANWEGAAAEAHVQWARETDAAFRELGAEGAYAGFPGIGGTDEDFARMSYGDNYDRIAELKAEFDPDNLFTETSNVPPAGDRT